jgi:hypothetical protein
MRAASLWRTPDAWLRFKHRSERDMRKGIISGAAVVILGSVALAEDHYVTRPAISLTGKGGVVMQRTEPEQKPDYSLTGKTENTTTDKSAEQKSGEEKENSSTFKVDDTHHN